MNPEQTQRLEFENMPARCVEHVRRLDKLEARVDSVERRISGIEDLRMMVQLLVDRMRLVMWMTGVATTGIILGVIGLFFGKLQ